ncbi:MAG: 50S ribosomal protein L22 [Candidatus Omnitrophica bacterium]|nr:50S ribosomal protein L22 [Candidatus Omnitrophota bacterium]
MIGKAEVKYARVSARKVRLVTDLIKGKTVEDANFILDNLNKGASTPIKKVVNSAFANVNHGKQEKILSKDAFISAIKADGGPIFHRYRAATMGRATPIRHRTAHIYVELDQVPGSEVKKEERGKKKQGK